MNKQILTKGGAVLGVIILLISFTSAFAVSSKYWEDNALTIYPGQEQNFSVVLQNLAGTPNDVEVRGEITQGGDYVTFRDGIQDFSVPFGTKVEVPLSISVSQYTDIGEKFSILISFKVKTVGESGSFAFGSSIEREIPVKIISEPVVEKDSFNWMPWLIVVGIIPIVLLGLIYLRMKKNANK